MRPVVLRFAILPLHYDQGILQFDEALALQIQQPASCLLGLELIIEDDNGEIARVFFSELCPQQFGPDPLLEARCKPFGNPQGINRMDTPIAPIKHEVFIDFLIGLVDDDGLNARIANDQPIFSEIGDPGAKGQRRSHNEIPGSQSSNPALLEDGIFGQLLPMSIHELRILFTDFDPEGLQYISGEWFHFNTPLYRFSFELGSGVSGSSEQGGLRAHEDPHGDSLERPFHAAHDIEGVHEIGFHQSE